MATWDVFVSYRWIDPDQKWVRTKLVPQLQTAGLSVLLDVAKNGFVAGRDAICEMARAGRESQRTLSVWTPEYFADDRAVWFESLQARRRDLQGRHSTLVPILLCHTEIPDEFYGLVPIDWTAPERRATEWARLLTVLGAPHHNVPPPPGCSCKARESPIAVAVEPNAARHRVLSALSSQLTTPDPVSRYWLYIAIGSTGGPEARKLLERATDIEVEPFARRGIEDALELLS